MDMIAQVNLSPEQSEKIADCMARIAKLERERARLIAHMNRPHLVAYRWIRMRLIWLLN